MVQDGLTIKPGAENPAKVQPVSTTNVPRSIQPGAKDASQEDAMIVVQKKLDPELLAKITEELNENFRIFNTAISFSVDEKTGNTVIRIIDRDTEKVIREIPPSDLLALAARLTEIIGRIVDETA